MGILPVVIAPSHSFRSITKYFKLIPQSRVVIDSSKVAGRHWMDKYFLVPVHFVSDEFREACETAKITGLQFTPIGELDWLGVS